MAELEIFEKKCKTREYTNAAGLQILPQKVLAKALMVAYNKRISNRGIL